LEAKVKAKVKARVKAKARAKVKVKAKDLSPKVRQLPACWVLVSSRPHVRLAVPW